MENLIIGSPMPIGRMTKRKAYILRELEKAPSQTLLKRELLERAARDRSDVFDGRMISFERSFRRTMDGAVAPARDASFFEQQTRGAPVGILVRLLLARQRLALRLPGLGSPSQIGFCVDTTCAVPVFFEGNVPRWVFPPFAFGMDYKPALLTLREQLTEDDVRPHLEVTCRLFGQSQGAELAPLEATTLSATLPKLRAFGVLNGVPNGLISAEARTRLFRFR
jgi:hypothetical protein